MLSIATILAAGKCLRLGTRSLSGTRYLWPLGWAHPISQLGSCPRAVQSRVRALPLATKLPVRLLALSVLLKTFIIPARTYEHPPYYKLY
jgi:hypothetical protein